MADQLRALRTELEVERAKRHQLEQQIAEQSRLIEANSSAILSILTSRVWRGLAGMGGILLRLGLSWPPKRNVLAPAPVQDPGTGLQTGSHRVLAPQRKMDSQVHESQQIRESTKGAPADTNPRTAGELKEALSQVVAGHIPERTKSPLFTVITPVYNSKPEWLAEAALSVFQQTLSDWEWCVVDDCSQRTGLDSILSLLERDPRVTVHRLLRHHGISGAINAGIQTATGEFMCVLDHDDLLEPDALKRCCDVLQSGWDAVYTDEDKISENGDHLQRFCKPDWSPEYFRNYMYIGHLLCVKRELAIEIGGFKTEFDRVQDYEFFLRYSEKAGRIAHLGEILYHWRAVGGSVAQDQDAKGDLAPLQVAAVQAHLDRMRSPAIAAKSDSTHVVRIVPRERVLTPKISVIIPTSAAPPVLSSCLASLSERTNYSNLELICVHSGARDSHALDLARVNGANCVFSNAVLSSFDAYDLGARTATGLHLVFMSPAVEALTPNWAEEMLYYAEQDDVGAVGGLILTPDQVVQQGGIAVGGRSLVEAMWMGHESDSDGCFASLKSAHEVTALGSTCLMIRKDVFERSGGFQADSLTGGRDIDLCLRLISMDRRNIYTPYARFLDHAATFGHSTLSSSDTEILAKRWAGIIGAADRYYRPYDFGFDRIDTQNK